MNLLIIGNGFDLAHGLKTTYSDFLTWAYKNRKKQKYSEFNFEDYLDGNVYVKELFATTSGTWIDLENNLANIIGTLAKRNNAEQRELRLFFEHFLIPIFENYISEAVNKTKVLPKLLSVIRAERVLSFNYSNTFERVYGFSNAEICYVNGKANSDTSRSNIVFGCDYFDLSNRELSWYSKVFQRAAKRTDKRRIDWMAFGDGYDIEIVGHSLGKTDHDLLRPFIMNEKNTTTVYYHSEKSKHDLIYNMFEMVGEKFVDSHKIEFSPISLLTKG
ncbi:hypothetical protein FACS18949_01180 [Clostridia bacterium]|nr:hypothetical protein FACS18949_01180 [Clostridia bacterium]